MTVTSSVVPAPYVLAGSSSSEDEGDEEETVPRAAVAPGARPAAGGTAGVQHESANGMVSRAPGS